MLFPNSESRISRDWKTLRGRRELGLAWDVLYNMALLLIMNFKMQTPQEVSPTGKKPVILEPNKNATLHLGSGSNRASTGFPKSSAHHLASRRALFYFEVITRLYSKNLVKWLKNKTKPSNVKCWQGCRATTTHTHRL